MFIGSLLHIALSASRLGLYDVNLDARSYISHIHLLTMLYYIFNDGLNSKVKLGLWKSFCKEIDLLARNWASRNTIDV